MRWFRRLLAPRYRHRIGRLLICAPTEAEAREVLGMVRREAGW